MPSTSSAAVRDGFDADLVAVWPRGRGAWWAKRRARTRLLMAATTAAPGRLNEELLFVTAAIAARGGLNEVFVLVAVAAARCRLDKELVLVAAAPARCGLDKMLLLVAAAAARGSLTGRWRQLPVHWRQGDGTNSRREQESAKKHQTNPSSNKPIRPVETILVAKVQC